MRELHKYTKLIITLTLAVTSIVILLALISNITKKYVICTDDTIVAVSKDKYILTNTYKEITKKAEKSGLNINSKLKLKEENFLNIENMTKEEIEKSLMNSVKVSAYKMKSNGKNIGYVKNKTIGEHAIKIVEDKYIAKSNLKNLKNVTLKNKIEYEKSNCLVDQIEDEIGIANKIIERNNAGEKLVTFTATYEEFNNIAVKKNEKKEVTSKEVLAKNSLGAPPVFANRNLYTPTIGVISSYFGERWGTVHKGLDIAANTGTPISAAFDGNVKFSGVMSGYGNVIIVEHKNGIETVYAHCNTLIAKVGESVGKGQKIATVGNTGNSTGPHLHFEIKVNGTPVDPLSYSE